MWWSWLASFLGGPVINGLISAYKAKLDATNTTDAQAVDLAKKELEAQIAANAEATKVMAIEEGRWWTAAPRAVVTWSFAIFVAKCVVYDKVFGLGSTDPLAGDIKQWAGWVMGVWFGGRSLEKVARIFKR